MTYQNGIWSHLTEAILVHLIHKQMKVMITYTVTGECLTDFATISVTL